MLPLCILPVIARKPTGLMTHHVAYTLQFEQAMQLINPTLTIPYWEYTLEGEICHLRLLIAVVGCGC